MVSVGYVTEGRGQDVLIRALPRVLAEFPDARYVLVGDPFPRPQDLAYRQYLAGLISQLKLQREVTLAGHLEDVADVYAAADLLVGHHYHHQVAVRHYALPFQLSERDGRRRDLVLHVERAPPPHLVDAGGVADELTAEPVARPAGGVAR